ncbi:hypothetical protein [uncultured Parolsenella sp.]|uniref:hypothetical protein n=1 Tax=uncultured Parolsenella sp. TaxID=2083008 RepID=UPI0025E3F3CB|nr:hypothetical protein [uncultured Parolsenella sp.]
MDETDEPHASLCGNCARFSVLDDQPGDPCKWFGICRADLRETWPAGVADVDATLNWVFDYGRHGNDDCERPDEWFEEG